MPDETRIFLIHALEESVQPARAAFTALWPEARCFDLLDTSLATDRAHRGALDETMFERFAVLADYAASAAGQGGQTAGLLFTCSAFGPAIDRVKARLAIPVLAPNEAAFAAALDKGSRLGLVVSFAPSLSSLETELNVMAAARGQAVTVRPILAEGALAALKAGRPEEHDRLVSLAASQITNIDAIILGQFSLARAAPVVRQHCAVPVLATPASAVVAMRQQLVRR